MSGCLQVQTEPLGFPLQNYMAPLRLVLSPADMAAIFINLEVRAQPPHHVRALILTSNATVPTRGMIGPGQGVFLRLTDGRRRTACSCLRGARL